jgi:hypothetical protein
MSKTDDVDHETGHGDKVEWGMAGAEANSRDQPLLEESEKHTLAESLSWGKAYFHSSNSVVAMLRRPSHLPLLPIIPRVGRTCA